MKKLSFIPFLAMQSFAVMAASAQQGIAPPQLGFIAAADRSLRPVLGFPGNLLLGSAAADNIQSAAWSGSYGLAKSDDLLMAFDGTHMLGSIDVSRGPALFAFHSDGSPALALLPQSGELYSWTGAGFKLITFREDLLEGNPLAIAVPQFDRVSVIVQRAYGLWLVVESTSDEIESQSALPGVQAPVLLQNDGGLLYMDQTSLVIRDGSGNERRMKLSLSMAELHWMGTEWLQAVEANSGHQYAMRITPGFERISQIPEARQ
jgi:hypothetical protein